MEETAILAAALAGREAIPRALAEALHGRARGNPFFIEEVVNLLKARGTNPRDPQALASIWMLSRILIAYYLIQGARGAMRPPASV